MLSHQTIFTKRHNAQSYAHDEINEIFDNARKYLDYLMTNSEGTPLYTELLYLSGDVTKFKNDLSHINELERRIVAREFRNVFSIACNPDYSANEKAKQLELFRNRMRGSSLSTKERLIRDSMFSIGLALIPIVAIVVTAILCTPLTLIALAAAIPIFITACIFTGNRNDTVMSQRTPKLGEELSNNMISLVKNHNRLFARPKMNDIAPPPYEQVARYGMA